jgi:hypothetical protein
VRREERISRRILAVVEQGVEAMMEIGTVHTSG